MSLESSDQSNIIRPAVFATSRIRHIASRDFAGLKRRRPLERARQGDRDLGHDLRTPLNAIIGFSEMMLEGSVGEVDNEIHREYLEHVRRSGLELLETVRELLDQRDIADDTRRGYAPPRRV